MNSNRVSVIADKASEGIKRVVKKPRVGRRLSKFKADMSRISLIQRYREEAKAAGKQYLFSVILADYNAGRYLEEAVNSLAKQTIGFENIQVIVVNDGSTDNTALVCEELMAMYPNNVFCFNRENSGVSSARNFGLAKSDGLFIGFLDADDKISNDVHYEVLKFAAQHDDIKVFALRTNFFGSKKGGHPLNYICAETKIIDLNTDFDYYPLSATRSYFHYSVLEGKTFCENLHYTEDSLIVHEIMLENPRFGAVQKPCYYYRKRKEANSASDYSTTDRRWYCETLERSHRKIFNTAVEKHGYVPRYIQYAVLYDLYWRVRANMPAEIAEELGEIYKDLLVDTLKRIDDEVIMALRSADLPTRLYIFALKHEIPLESAMDALQTDGEDLVFDLEIAGTGHDVCAFKSNAKWNKMRIDILELSRDGKTIYLEGHLPRLCLNSKNVSLIFNANGINHEAELFPDPHTAMRAFADAADQHSIKPQLCFKASIPASQQFIVEPKIKIGDGSFTTLAIEYGQYARLNSAFPNSSYYVLENGQIVYLNGTDSSFSVSNPNSSIEEIEDRERQYINDISSQAHPLWIRLRKRILHYRAEHPEERLWIFTDRVTSAEDSGEVMYRYMLEHPVENLRTVFIIRKDAPDYGRLKLLGGEIIAANTPEHFIAVACADKIISSAADGWVLNPYGTGFQYLKDLLHFRFVFLQHGVIKDSIASWLYKTKKNIDLFITSAPRERQSIIEGDYGYDEDNVILTGLPRWDSFEGWFSNSCNTIYLMPTWRDYLSTGFSWDASTATSTSSLISNFHESDYFRFYQSVLVDPTLYELLEKYDYKLKFAPHPRISSSIGAFTGNDRVEIIVPESFSYSDAYKEMSMLITDYSSIAFNVAILRKPIIYAQFDFETFYSKHTGKKDYYEYERDGFGPVVKTKDQLVDQIRFYLENGMVMHPEYKERVDSFFYWPENGESRAQCVMREIERKDASQPYAVFRNDIYSGLQQSEKAD